MSTLIGIHVQYTWSSMCLSMLKISSGALDNVHVKYQNGKKVW